MISLAELNPHSLPLTAEQEANQRLLFNAVNKFRALYGQPMIVTSGVRDEERQANIDTLAGRAPRLGSMHIKGAAADFRDGDDAIKAFIAATPGVLEGCGLYMEDPAYTPTWVHLQCLPPKSGKRVFIPYAGLPPTGARS